MYILGKLQETMLRKVYMQICWRRYRDSLATSYVNLPCHEGRCRKVLLLPVGQVETYPLMGKLNLMRRFFLPLEHSVDLNFVVLQVAAADDETQEDG
jgi:hypothetical protein